MKVYLDICCLKRPFDDQTQPRIAVETAAVLAVLRFCEGGNIQALRSSAHDLENGLNSDPRRAASVAAWLASLNPPTESNARIAANLSRFRAAGLGAFDALHVAWALELRADAFLTTDDRLIARASRLTEIIPCRIMNPASFVEELPR